MHQIDEKEKERSLGNKLCIVLPALVITGFTIVMTSSIFRGLLPLGYFLGLLLIGLASLGLFSKYGKLPIIFIIILGLAVRLFQVIGTERIVWYDALIEKQVMKIWLAESYVHTPIDWIDKTKFTDTMFAYSGWPQAQILGVITSQITSISLDFLSTYLPIILYICGALVIERFSHTTFKNNKISTMALLIFVLWPETLYYGTQFTRQNLAYTLFIIAVYAIAKFMHEKSATSWCLISLLVLSSIVVSHNLMTIITIYTLIGLSLTFLLLKRRSNFLNLRKRQEKSMRITVILLALAYLFWFTYARMVVDYFSGYVRWNVLSFWNLITFRASVDPIIQARIPRMAYASMPFYAKLIPIIRDVMILCLTLSGALYILKREKLKLAQNTYRLITFSLFCTYIALAFLGYVNVLPEAPRVLFYIAIPASVFSGYTLNEINEKGRALKICITVLLLFFIFVSSFALWGHEGSPLTVYDFSNDPSLRYIYPVMNEQDMGAMMWINNVRNTKQSYIVGIAGLKEQTNQTGITVASTGSIDGLIMMAQTYETYNDVRGLGEVGERLIYFRFHTYIIVWSDVKFTEEALNAYGRRFVSQFYLETPTKIYDNGRIAIFYLYRRI